MKVFLIRYLCGMLGPLILFTSLVIYFRLSMQTTELRVILCVIELSSGFIHIIRLRNIPSVQWEFAISILESVLVAIIGIVGLHLLLVLNSELLLMIGVLIAFVAILIYPSHVVIWDFKHGHW